MVAFSSVLAFALLASRALGSPLVHELSTRSSAQGSRFDLGNIFCQLPIINRILCPSRQSSPSVTTPLGTALGAQDGAGVRFAVRYGT
jgi:hypothetical protein